MTDEDIFFTHTVVGQAMSVELGRPLDRKTALTPSITSGLQANLSGSSFSLPEVWKEWCLIQGAYPYVGLPRRRPGSFRRWLERHALVIAVAGLLMLILSAALLVIAIWLPDLVIASWRLPHELAGPKL